MLRKGEKRVDAIYFEPFLSCTPQPLAQSQLGAQENNTFTFILLPPLVAMRILFAEIFVSVAEREKRAMIYTLF